MSQTQRISKNNTAIMKEAGVTKVILHSTPVVTIDENKSTLTFNNGGWVTATTVTRMNQVCNKYGLAWGVSRKGGEMVAIDNEGNKYPFVGNKCVCALRYR